MLETLRKRHRALVAGQAVEASESGFTLIELMVVVLIIAILMAIAIPAFLGAKNSAQDNAAQQDISNIITDAAAVYANSQEYFGESAAITATEKNITVQAAGTNSLAKNNQVTLAVPAASAADEAILLTTQSATGDCWLAWVDTQNGTQYAVDTTEKGTATACPGTDIPATSTAGTPHPAGLVWKSAWNQLTG